MSRANICEAYYRLKYRKASLLPSEVIEPETVSAVQNETFPPPRLLRRSASTNLATDKVKQELIQHRKSMWNALQESRDEVECLQKQCAINTEIIAQHDDDIAEIRKKEKAWQQRCLIAEAELQNKSEDNDSLRCYKRLVIPQSKKSAESRNDEAALQKKSEERELQNNSDESKQSVEDQLSIAEAELQNKSEENDSLQCYKKLVIPQSKKSTESRNDEAALQRKSEQRELQKNSDESKQSVEDQNDEAEFNEIWAHTVSSEQTVSSRYHKIISFPQSGLSWLGRNDNQNKLELALKISSRNEAISSLEQTIDDNIKSIQDLQAEMQSLVVTQQMKVKEICDSHAEKEEDFKGQVKSLRKELLRLLRKNSRIAANRILQDK